MKDYQAPNQNSSPSVGSVDSVDLISLKIYKLSILYHSKKKYRCCQKKPTESTQPTVKRKIKKQAQNAFKNLQTSLSGLQEKEKTFQIQ